MAVSPYRLVSLPVVVPAGKSEREIVKQTLGLQTERYCNVITSNAV